MLNKYLKVVLILVSYAVVSAAQADTSTMFKQVVDKPMNAVYPAVYQALEDARFFVVFEANIGKNLTRFADRWGEDYNRSQLNGIRSMVFCNVWYANAVSNADPDMLGLCPLRLSLYEKNGATTILFARPSVIAAKSKALSTLKEVEAEVITAIKRAAKKVQSVSSANKKVK